MATAQFIVKYEQAGKEALNIGYVSGDWSNAVELAQVADNIYQNWGANIMPSLSVDCTLTGVECRDLTDVYVGNAGGGGGFPGGNPGTAEAISTALVITRTDGASRRQGRWFLPGVPSAEVNAAALVNLGWAANIAGQFQVSQLNLGPVFNSAMMNRHKIPNTNTFLYASIEGFGFLPIAGVQRDRRDN